MGDGQPKYLNSPDTPVFNKRRVLYNLNYARDKAFEKRRIVVCEGYMDVIAQAKYGFDYAVAPLGTALTEEQIAEAWKSVRSRRCVLTATMPASMPPSVRLTGAADFESRLFTEIRFSARRHGSRRIFESQRRRRI